MVKKKAAKRVAKRKVAKIKPAPRPVRTHATGSIRQRAPIAKPSGRQALSIEEHDSDHVGVD